MEHRWGQRSNLRVAVQLRIGDGAATSGYLQNLSVSGAFVLTRSLAAVGTLLELEVPLGNHHGLPLPSACAYVARRSPEGLGIEWCDLAPPLALALLGGQGTETWKVLRIGDGLLAPDTPPSTANRAAPARRVQTPRVSAA